jgi:DNA polymerase
MPVDLDAVRKLVVARDHENLRLGAEFKILTGGELASPKQVEKLRAKLATLGVDLADLQRETLELQNLPKSKLADPGAMLGQLLDRADGIVAGTIDPMGDPSWPVSIKEAIASCLRGVFKAPEDWRFVAADLGQIESRVLCWIAGQDDKLEAYRDGRDVYTLEADALGSFSRDLGKLFVLSAGFGASSRVMFSRAPGFDVVLTEEEAAELTERWRANNAAIVEFWYALFRQLCFVVEMPAEQEPVAFRGLHIWRDPEMLYVQLPSGRCLKYRDPQLEVGNYGSPALSVQLPKHKKPLPVSLWHGAATENVVQAIAYDVLSEKMLRLHQDGVFLVGTIHDEIVALAHVDEADATLEYMVKVMQAPPVWAADLPLAADGFINECFIKPTKPAHAPLAPSAAERWMNCPGSVAAIQALPEAPESTFAAEGTEAHRIFAACLERDLDLAGFTTDFLTLQPLRNALMIARDVIVGRRFKVEIRLDPLPGLGKVWGTADVLIFDQQDRIVAILDLKFGAGVTVEPDTLQLQVYALLAAQQYGCPHHGIDLHIVQPRRQHEQGPHRMHHIGITDLERLFARLGKAVAATEDKAAPKIAGDWCRFCGARQGCPEARFVAPRQPNPFRQPRSGYLTNARRGL